MSPIMANSKDGQEHKDKYLIPVERSCHKKRPSAIWKLLCLFFRSYEYCHFSKNWSNVKVKKLSTSKDFTCITRDIHMKYQSFSNHYLNAMNKVKELPKSRPDSNVKVTSIQFLNPQKGIICYVDT